MSMILTVFSQVEILTLFSDIDKQKKARAALCMREAVLDMTVHVKTSFVFMLQNGNERSIR